MTRKALKSTTAILTAMSLLQPLPSLAQSSQEASDAATAAPVEADIAKQADAEALAAAEAEAQPSAEANAQAEAASAKADADAAALAAEQAEAEAQAAADAAAQAEANAAAEAEANAAADKEAEARAAADAEAEAQAAAKAERKKSESNPEAETQADAAIETDTAEPAAEAQQTAPAASGTNMDVSEACLAEVIASDGSVACVDTLTGESIEALATDADAETSAEVTTETVTEQTSRSSSEEFREWSPEDQARGTTAQSVAPKSKSKDGMSDLQKAGLLALGAVVVGAIVLNGQRVEANTGDRVVVVDDDNDYRILKDDDALLRQPGSDVRTQRFSDGSTRSNVLRGDGTEIITIRDSTGRVLRRELVETDGRQYVLFDDTRSFEPVLIRDLPEPASNDFDYQGASDRDSLRRALFAADQRDIGRSFSLRQVRDIHEVRQLSPEINLQNITFATASSAIQPSQAEQLRQMGLLMSDLIADDPTELFLIEGYTDAIGAPGNNLLLSDRRAESVALALSEYFDVPTENLVVQGYGERFLKVPTQAAERLNRRVAVRRITTLVRESGL